MSRYLLEREVLQHEFRDLARPLQVQEVSRPLDLDRARPRREVRGHPGEVGGVEAAVVGRSEEHTSELQSH